MANIAASGLGALDSLNKGVNRIYRCGLPTNVASAAESITPEKAKVVLDRMRNLPPSERARLSQKLFYVSSQVEPSKLKLGAHVMSEPNDSTVPYRSQFLTGIGRRLGDLKGIAHRDLFLTDSLSGISAKDRAAFARTLLGSLLDL